jgi:hypothetical protein
LTAIGVEEFAVEQ